MTPEKRTNEEIAEEVASVPFHDMLAVPGIKFYEATEMAVRS